MRTNLNIGRVKVTSYRDAACGMRFVASLTPVSAHFLRQESIPSDYLRQATCVTLGVMLKFDAAHDFCRKTQAFYMKPPLLATSRQRGRTATPRLDIYRSDETRNRKQLSRLRHKPQTRPNDRSEQNLNENREIIRTRHTFKCSIENTSKTCRN